MVEDMGLVELNGLSIESTVKALKRHKDGYVEIKDKGGDVFYFKGTKEQYASIWAFYTINESSEIFLEEKLVDRLKSLYSMVEFELVDAVIGSIKLYNQLFFKEVRLALGLNQDELAEKLSWSKQQISNIEGGVRDLQLQTKLALECLLRREDKLEEFKESFPFYENK